MLSPNVDSMYWDFGDPASGVNNTSNLFNPSHTYSDTGLYTIMQTVISIDGCLDYISHSLGICPATPPCNISIGTIEYTSKQPIRIYPNPNTGQFTLEMDLHEETWLSIKLFHFTGQLIESEEVGNVNGNYTHRLDLKGYSKGVYFVQISTDLGILTQKVVLY